MSADLIVADTWPPELAAGPLLDRVRAGARLVLCHLPPGQYSIADTSVDVFEIGSGSRLILEQNAQGSFAVGRVPDHQLLAGFRVADFSYWTQETDGQLGAVCHRAFRAPGWSPILVWGDASHGLVAAERAFGAGRIVVCTLELQHQMRFNPVAALFIRRLLAGPNA
jgi:hypothetical protein